jgi:O-antigen biosynthesis protein
VHGGNVLSVFTPSHNPAFLTDCFQSLQAQTLEDWEWVVLLNQRAEWTPPLPDPRVRVVAAPGFGGVGAAKYRACAEARGDILVELDHDDLLASNALHAIHAAFTERPEMALVYSPCAQILEDGRRDDSTFNTTYGWESRDARVDGRAVRYPIALQPTPHNVSYI